MSCAHSESKEMPHQIISSTEYSYKKRHIMNHQRAWRIKRLFSSIRNISKKYYISSNYVMHTTLLLCSYTERVIICRQLPFHYSWLRSLNRVWEKRKCHENRLVAIFFSFLSLVCLVISQRNASFITKNEHRLWYQYLFLPVPAGCWIPT